MSTGYYWSPELGESVRVRWYSKRGDGDPVLVREVAGTVCGKRLGQAPEMRTVYELTDGQEFDLLPQCDGDPVDRTSEIIWAEPELMTEGET